MQTARPVWMQTPVWVQSSAAQLSQVSWSRTTRFRVFFAILALSFVYTLSTFLWEDGSTEWEDGAIPISYADKDWEPYTPVEQLEDDPNATYIYTPLADNFYLPTHATLPSELAVPAPGWMQPPQSCLDEIVGSGTDCTGGWQAEKKLDFVWTWVNSSDPVWSEARAAISAQLLGKPKVNVDPEAAMAHFRDYDELRHSIRSVLMHFQPYARQFNILASDFAPPGELLSSPLRLGQAPQWLDSSRDPVEWWHNDVQLKVHHHVDFFRPYFETVFSSFAIESQLGNLPADVNDLFVYMNDDMYFLRDLKPADFYTSAYGFVFRLVYYITIPPTLDPKPQRGEWQALRESNWLIGQRFGPSTRPYRSHMPKIMSVALLHEMAETFPDAFARTGARPMRAVWRDGEGGDVHPGFMFAHYIVERWREGLLWSWAVARMGGDDDTWDAAAAWQELRGGDAENIWVGRIVRESLSDALQQLWRAGYESPGASFYFFSSLDGYPYYSMRQTGSQDHPSLMDPNICSISRSECFPPEITSASEAFAHIAFKRPQCGDCVINRLVQNSGRRGLSAVLPPTGRTFAAASTGSTATTLPKVSRWEEGSFALNSILSHSPTPEVIDVRGWTLRMLHRYRFVLADSPYEFVFLVDDKSTQDAVDRLQGHDKAFACMNDDVENDDDAVAVEAIMHEWQDMRWGEPAAWEAPT